MTIDVIRAGGASVYLDTKLELVFSDGNETGSERVEHLHFRT
jgi:hypothetical protein